jgi:hypothetical protein
MRRGAGRRRRWVGMVGGEGGFGAACLGIEEPLIVEMLVGVGVVGGRGVEGDGLADGCVEGDGCGGGVAVDPDDGVVVGVCEAGGGPGHAGVEVILIGGAPAPDGGLIRGLELAAGAVAVVDIAADAGPGGERVFAAGGGGGLDDVEEIGEFAGDPGAGVVLTGDAVGQPEAWRSKLGRTWPSARMRAGCKWGSRRKRRRWAGG